MEPSNHKWTIWGVTKEKGHYHVRVNSIGGPSGNTCTIELKDGRMQLLLDFFNVKRPKKLQFKTFESHQTTGAAAVLDLLLGILQFD